MVDTRQQVKRDKYKKIDFFKHAAFSFAAKKQIEKPVSIYFNDAKLPFIL